VPQGQADEISPAQLRAARAWLGLTQAELALRAGVGRGVIAEYERGSRLAHPSSLTSLKSALEELGIRFLFEDRRGVGLKAS
jgi:transcriptional regulator with XRE-family HTH domain